MKTQGSIIIAVIYAVLVSFIGLTLLTFSYLHNKIEGVRTRKAVETVKIRRDLVLYLHRFREKVLGENMAELDAPESSYFSQALFPGEKIGATTIENSFSTVETQKQDYKKIRIIAAAAASSSQNNYAYNAEAHIDLLTGQIPITMFPVFINKKIDSTVDTYLEKNRITGTDGKKILVDDIETEIDMKGFLKDAIEIEKGCAVTWEAIREQFGFEISSEPIPDGVHLLFEADVLKLIFIQGDAERIVFSVDGGIQKIGITKNNMYYHLSYKPGEDYCRLWDDRISELSLFKEKIVVNGNAWSIEQSGEAAFLQSSNIVLFVSGRAVITTGLETEHIDLQEIFLANLVLLSGSDALPGQDSTLEAGVVIDAEEEVNLQAAVLTEGKVTNNSSKLNLSGSLYAGELENKGKIEAAHKNSKFDTSQYFVTKDFKYISDFFINFIEEVYNAYE